MRWTTADETLHIKGLPNRAKACAMMHNVTLEQYILAYGESMKKRTEWGDIDRYIAFFEFNKIKGNIQKRNVA